MSRWFRVYDDVINDPKILKLPEESRWHWIALLCIASKNDGALPSTEDVAISLRVKLASAAAIIASLKTAGLLDLVDGRYVPHNWDGRQFKSDTSNERVKRYRQRKCNVTDAVTVTPPDTDTDTEHKQKEDGAIAPLDPATPEREFFARGKATLGQGAGGMLAKLLKAKGGNVALARAAIEQASQKENPTEYVAAICRGSAMSAKPLTEFQRKQQETNDVRSHLRNYANGGGSGGNSDRLLSNDPGKRPENLRHGAGADILALPRASGSGGD
jgi:hypothetical protein